MFQFGWKDDAGKTQLLYVDFWRTGEFTITADVTRGELSTDNKYREIYKQSLDRQAELTNFVPKNQRMSLKRSLKEFLLESAKCVGVDTEDEDLCYDCGLPASDNMGGLNTYIGETQTVELCDECQEQRKYDDAEELSDAR